MGVSVLSFLFLSLAPGNYFDEMRLNPQISQETVASLRAQYGLDRPLPVRYVRWFQSVLRGDLGYSFAYNLPTAPLLRARAYNHGANRLCRRHTVQRFTLKVASVGSFGDRSGRTRHSRGIRLNDNRHQSAEETAPAPVRNGPDSSL